MTKIQTEQKLTSAEVIDLIKQCKTNTDKNLEKDNLPLYLIISEYYETKKKWKLSSQYIEKYFKRRDFKKSK